MRSSDDKHIRSSTFCAYAMESMIPLVEDYIPKKKLEKTNNVTLVVYLYNLNTETNKIQICV